MPRDVAGIVWSDQRTSSMWRLMPDEGPPGTPVTIEVRLFFSSYPPYTKNWYDWYGRGDGSTLYAEERRRPRRIPPAGAFVLRSWAASSACCP